MRSTRQRVAVAESLGALDRFASAQEVHDHLRHAGEAVGLTTVYRTLQAMADAGEIDALRNEAGEVCYRRCHTEAHHHHMVCRRCGRTVELPDDEVEEWAERVARKHDFLDVAHTVEMTGVCGPCARARQPKAKG